MACELSQWRLDQAVKKADNVGFNRQGPEMVQCLLATHGMAFIACISKGYPECWRLRPVVEQDAACKGYRHPLLGAGPAGVALELVVMRPVVNHLSARGG